MISSDQTNDLLTHVCALLLSALLSGICDGYFTIQRLISGVNPHSSQMNKLSARTQDDW